VDSELKIATVAVFLSLSICTYIRGPAVMNSAISILSNEGQLCVDYATIVDTNNLVGRATSGSRFA
jgi:hypothetical protein